MEEERMRRLLENIFRAISEDLVAELIRTNRNLEIPLYKIDSAPGANHRTSLSRNRIGNLLIAITSSVSQPFRVDEYETDPEHKIDVVIGVDRDLFAVEVKAGETGLVVSPASFLDFCLKKRAKVGRNHRIAGLMPSILSHTTDEDTLGQGYNVFVGDQIINRTWYLCLRQNNQWNRPSDSRARQDTAIACRISSKLTPLISRN